MVDLDNKMQRSDPVEGKTTEESEIKRCADCGTSKTPLWRSGPAGPKSLCNACGIRSRKKGRVYLGIHKSEQHKRTKNSNSGGSNSTSSNNSGVTSTAAAVATTTTATSFPSGGKLRGASGASSNLHQRLISFGREVMMQRSTVGKRTVRRRKLGEEEQAAVLLMALSCGAVYA